MLTVHVTKVFESGHMASFMYVFWKTFKEKKGADFFDIYTNISIEKKNNTISIEKKELKNFWNHFP